MSDYSIFIVGESVDLCVPSRLAIERDGWADWFNDKETTRFLDQGVFPMFEEDQRFFLDSLRNQNRLALLIKPRNKERVIGTVSLSSIKWISRSAQIAIVIDRRERMPQGNLYALEAMSLMTEHAFETMGLSRIWAGQAYPGLKKWTKHLELLGYRTEALLRKASVKGRREEDAVTISCLYENYRAICDSRGGRLWKNHEEMTRLRDEMPAQGFAEILDPLIREAARAYFGD